MTRFLALPLVLALAACGGSGIPDEPVFRAGAACFKDPGVINPGQRVVLEDCSTGPAFWFFRHYDAQGVLRAEVTGGLRPEFVFLGSGMRLEVVYCVGTECVTATRGEDGRLQGLPKLK